MKTMRAADQVHPPSSILRFDDLFSVLQCCESETYVSLLRTCKTLDTNATKLGLTERKKMTHYLSLDRGEHYVSMADVANVAGKPKLQLQWNILDNGGTPWSLRVLRDEKTLRLVGEYAHAYQGEPNIGKTLWECSDFLGYWIGEDDLGKYREILTPGANILVEVGYRSYVAFGAEVRFALKNVRMFAFFSAYLLIDFEFH